MIRTDHQGFTLHRRLPQPPARAFRWFSDPERKRRWTDCHPDWRRLSYEVDFRPGGQELVRQGIEGGPVQEVRSTFYDIRPGERLVYGYGMSMDGRPVSASLVTLEFRAEGGGTLLIWTEQVAALDGLATAAGLEGGTGWALDRLGAMMAGG